MAQHAPFRENVMPIAGISVAHSVPVSDQRRKALIAGGVPIALLFMLFVAWGVSAVVSGDQVNRNVTAAGVELGGLDEADLAAVASDLNEGLTTEPANIKVGDVLLATNLFEVGVRVDNERLTTDALAAREGGFILARPFAWLASFFNTVEVPVHYVVDDRAAAGAARVIVSGQLAEPTDPYFESTDAGLSVVPGMDGSTIDFEAAGATVQNALDKGAPYLIEMQPLPVTPTIELAMLEAIANEANAATAQPIVITMLSESTVVESTQLRAWISLDNESSPPSWSFDNAAIVNELRPRFPDLGTEDQRAHFQIADGKPVIVPGSEAVLCCDSDSADRIKSAVLGPLPTPTEDDDPDAPVLRSVELAPDIADSDEGVAQLEALGIVEEISTFTTSHSCCQNRVKNIQRMAAIVQGFVIRPGERFDLNEIVGKRTRDGGFLPAGAIAQGVLEDQVGGGVSQFTTTMFNAAFFGGLDFIEYQAHSLYFSRYPRGREATISWPKPDFIVENNTAYGILVWPTWTHTTITVTLYSTQNIVSEDVGRSETAQGSCTRVTTTRERTFADGRVERDTVFAVYRPGEGLDCNGNSTVPTTTTTVDPNATSSTDTSASTTSSSTDTTAATTTTTVEVTTTTTTEVTTTTTEAPTG